LNGIQSGMTFEKAIARYGEVMIFGDSSIPQGVLTFDKTVTNTINGFTYTAYGFNIWNFTASGWITMRNIPYSGFGPVIFDLYSINMPSHSVSLHSPADWKNVYGNFTVTLEKPNNPNILLYLMVK